ncbi:tyrosine-type recombinase/integrase [Bdellovibrionota bacterium FG-1]
MVRSYRINLRRLDEWLKVTRYDLNELTWPRLMEFHRYLATQGITTSQCIRAVQIVKKTLLWGIQQGILNLKVEDIYTFHSPWRNRWNPSLPPLSNEYLAQIQATRPGAFANQRYVQRVFHTFLADRKLTYRKLRREHLAAYVKFINEKGFRQESRTDLVRAVRTYLVWLHENKKIKRRPDELLDPRFIPKRRRAMPRPLDPETDMRLQAILTATDDHIFKAILLLRRTGLRITELRRMEFDCLHFDPKGRATLKVPTIKLGVERRVPLDPETIELVRKIQRMSLAHHEGKNSPRYLMIGPGGLPPRYPRYAFAIHDLCVRLRAKKWINLHSLRHTYATALLNAGLSITSLKELLGHRSISMSLLYAKVTQEKLHAEFSDAMTRLNRQHIPALLEPKNIGIDAAFAQVASLITKEIDSCEAPDAERKFHALLNRLSKIKSAAIQIQRSAQP